MKESNGNAGGGIGKAPCRAFFEGIEAKRG
jgi:hypothetical protein